MNKIGRNILANLFLVLTIFIVILVGFANVSAGAYSYSTLYLGKIRPISLGTPSYYTTSSVNIGTTPSVNQATTANNPNKINNQYSASSTYQGNYRLTGKSLDSNSNNLVNQNSNSESEPKSIGVATPKNNNINGLYYKPLKDQYDNVSWTDLKYGVELKKGWNYIEIPTDEGFNAKIEGKDFIKSIKKDIEYIEMPFINLDNPSKYDQYIYYVPPKGSKPFKGYEKTSVLKTPFLGIYAKKNITLTFDIEDYNKYTKYMDEDEYYEYKFKKGWNFLQLPANFIDIDYKIFFRSKSNIKKVLGIKDGDSLFHVPDNWNDADYNNMRPDLERFRNPNEVWVYVTSTFTLKTEIPDYTPSENDDGDENWDDWPESLSLEEIFRDYDINIKSTKIKIEKPEDKFNLNQKISDFITILDEDDISILGGEIEVDGETYAYTEILDFTKMGNSGKWVFDKNNNPEFTDVDDYLWFKKNGDHLFDYHLDFDEPVNVHIGKNGRLGGLIGEKFNILGKDYVIMEAKDTKANGDHYVELVFVSWMEEYTINEGDKFVFDDDYLIFNDSREYLYAEIDRIYEEDGVNMIDMTYYLTYGYSPVKLEGIKEFDETIIEYTTYEDFTKNLGLIRSIDPNEKTFSLVKGFTALKFRDKITDNKYSSNVFVNGEDKGMGNVMIKGDLNDNTLNLVSIDYYAKVNENKPLFTWGQDGLKYSILPKEGWYIRAAYLLGLDFDFNIPEQEFGPQMELDFDRDGGNDYLEIYLGIANASIGNYFYGNEFSFKYIPLNFLVSEKSTFKHDNDAYKSTRLIFREGVYNSKTKTFNIKKDDTILLQPEDPLVDDKNILLRYDGTDSGVGFNGKKYIVFRDIMDENSYHIANYPGINKEFELEIRNYSFKGYINSNDNLVLDLNDDNKIDGKELKWKTEGDFEIEFWSNQDVNDLNEITTTITIPSELIEDSSKDEIIGISAKIVDGRIKYGALNSKDYDLIKLTEDGETEYFAKTEYGCLLHHSPDNQEDVRFICPSEQTYANVYLTLN